MRDIKRIPMVLDAIRKIWESDDRFVDLRFWQLMPVFQSYINGIHRQQGDADLFYMEDEEFLRGLEKFIDGM